MNTNNNKYLELILADKFLTQEQKDIVLGSLLGDASVKGDSKSEVATYTFCQGTVHADYFKDIHSKLANITNGNPPIQRTYFDKRYTKEYFSLSFVTKSIASLYPYFKLFYNVENGSIKVIPNCISELLTARALAYWIGDDGMYVKGGGLTLCTDCFTESEVLLLKSVLETKFNLICTIHNKKKQSRRFKKNLL